MLMLSKEDRILCALTRRQAGRPHIKGARARPGDAEAVGFPEQRRQRAEIPGSARCPRQVISSLERDVPRPRAGPGRAWRRRRPGGAPREPPAPDTPAGRWGGGALAAASLGWERLPKPASLRSGADSDVGKKEMALPSERAETTTSYNIPPPPDPAKQGS